VHWLNLLQINFVPRSTVSSTIVKPGYNFFSPTYRSTKLAGHGARRFCKLALDIDVNRAFAAFCAGSLPMVIRMDPAQQRARRHHHARANVLHRTHRIDNAYEDANAREGAAFNQQRRIFRRDRSSAATEEQNGEREARQLSDWGLRLITYRPSEVASLTRLSACIAHEINQPMAAIVANTHACQRWLSAEPPDIQQARAITERIIRDANAVAEGVRQIRTLFKRTTLSRTAVDVNNLIAEVRQEMSEEASTRNISLEVDLQRGMPLVIADREQMRLVLVNLMRNGFDATESTIDGPKLLMIRSCRDGTDKVLVEVRDHGCGVEDTGVIFEPFFTTKQDGLGVGLAICRSIIEANNGLLWATRNEPRGTTLAFNLPVYPGDSR
jgi:C4-dicarboxylate-specific signal transduction histidine kinase